MPPSSISTLEPSTVTISGFGAHLDRPECVLAFREGGIFASDRRHGVVRVVEGGFAPIPLAVPLPEGFIANGVTFVPGEGFLVANIGDEGGVWRLAPGEAPAPFLTSVGGRPLPPTNYVHACEDEILISCSTRRSPRHLAYNAATADGFALSVRDGQAKVIMEGLAYANEIRPSPDGDYLYVNETMGKRLVRAARHAPSGKRETVFQFGAGDFVDGLGFDRDGGVWAAAIISNRVWRINPEAKEATLIVSDTDAAHTDWVEAAYARGEMARAHMDAPMNARLKNISSIAWTGETMTTVMLGSLLSDRLFSFETTHQGVEPLHWAAPSPF